MLKKYFKIIIALYFSFGSLYLVNHWRPDWGLYINKRKSSLSTADTLLLKVIYISYLSLITISLFFLLFI